MTTKGTKLRAAEKKGNCKREFMKGNVGEFSITLTKPIDAPAYVRFVVHHVSVRGEVVWSFNEENFDGYAFLADPKGVPCICLVSKDKELRKLIPIDTLLQKVEQEERIKKLFEPAREKIRHLLKLK